MRKRGGEGEPLGLREGAEFGPVVRGVGMPLAVVGNVGEGLGAVRARGDAGDDGRGAGDEGRAGGLGEGGEDGEHLDRRWRLVEGVIADEEGPRDAAGGVDGGVNEDGMEGRVFEFGGGEGGGEFGAGGVEEEDLEIGVGVEAGDEEMDGAPGGLDGLEGGVVEDGAHAGAEGFGDERLKVGLIGAGGGDGVGLGDGADEGFGGGVGAGGGGGGARGHAEEGGEGDVGGGWRGRSVRLRGGGFAGPCGG